MLLSVGVAEDRLDDEPLIPSVLLLLLVVAAEEVLQQQQQQQQHVLEQEGVVELALLCT